MEQASRPQPWGWPALTGRTPLVMAAGALFLLVWPFALGLGIAVAVIAVAAVLAADLLLAPRPGTIGVNRHLPTLLSLGDKGEVSWILSNPHRRSLRVAIADELAPSLGASARRAKLNVPAGGHFGIPGTLSVRAVLTPTRRGLFTPTELVVRTEGPLGLMARQSPRRLAGELRVYPSFGSRREAELRIERNRILEVGLRSARSRGVVGAINWMSEKS